MDSSKISEASKTLSQSMEAYQTLTKNRKVPASVLKNTKCIAVFPKVVTAALGVGGTHGDGVAFCRGSMGASWDGPVFLDLTGGSLGIQAGVKSTDVVLFMTGDKARSAIQNGSFRLAGDFSAVAGSFDETYVAPPAGVVAYTSTDGLFAGAAVAGVDISHDKDEYRSFYGTYEPSEVLAGKVPDSRTRSVTDFRDLLPS